MFSIFVFAQFISNSDISPSLTIQSITSSQWSKWTKTIQFHPVLTTIQPQNFHLNSYQLLPDKRYLPAWFERCQQTSRVVNSFSKFQVNWNVLHLSQTFWESTNSKLSCMFFSFAYYTACLIINIWSLHPRCFQKPACSSLKSLPTSNSILSKKSLNCFLNYRE